MAKLKQILKTRLARVGAIEAAGKLPKISTVVTSLVDQMPEGPDLPTVGEREEVTRFTFVAGYETIVPKAPPKLKEIKIT